MIQGLDVLVQMARRFPPTGVGVVEGSTPVVAFGDPLRASVATLAINPSVAEFATGGVLLRGHERRLATLESLGIKRMEDATVLHARRIVEGCQSYFDRRPYWRWFGPLDDLLHTSTGTSYRDGTACHLDLVQWATDPVWGLLDQRARERLLAEGVPYLLQQLEIGSVRTVLLNGSAVVRQVQACGLVELVETGTLTETGLRQTRCWRLVTGERDGVRYFGWNYNLQSPYLASAQLRGDLASWIHCQLDADRNPQPACLTDTEPAGTGPRDARPASTLPCPPEPGRFLDKGTVVCSKTELAQLLTGWLSSSTAATIGDTTTFGRSALIRIELAAATLVLNADTTRRGVEEFLADDRWDCGWPVVTNRSGTRNKIAFGPEATTISGWYCYTTSPATEGTVL